MSKEIVILDKLDGGRYRYILWASVPAARQSFYANAEKTSAWTGASPTEVTALQNGSVVERMDTLAVDNLTIVQAEAALQTIFAAYQAEINAANPWLRYGSFWDGTSWTAGGVN